MNTVYIYHHNDHDGIVAAGILYNHLKQLKETYFDDLYENIVFEMIDYSKELNFDHIDFDNWDKAYFLDYSFSNKHNIDEFEKLLKRRIESEDVVWIDHHKSSVGLLDEYNIPGVRKEGLCGAAWTYLYCNELLEDWKETVEPEAYSTEFHKQNDIPLFVKLIDDYDCWKKIYATTNDFHYGLIVSHPTDTIIYNLLKSNSGIPDIISVGKQIQVFLNFDNMEYHVNMYGFEFTLPEEHGGYRCFCLNRKGNSLMFGNKVNEYDAVIPFYFNNGKWTYSIFTIKDNVDCLSVAKSYGGGGHPKAAGWTTNEFIFN